MIKQILLPELGEGILSGDILEIFVSKGDSIEKDQPLMELETEKATLEVPSDTAGKITRLLVKAGQEVKVGQAFLEMEFLEPKSTNTEVPEPVQPVAAQESTHILTPKKPTEPGEKKKLAGRIPVPAPPSVRKFAREIGIELSTVTGSGPGGRISMDDVKTHSRLIRQRAATQSTDVPDVRSRPLPDFSLQGSITRQKMTKIRKVTAKSITRSWVSIPHVTLHRFANITKLEKQRRELKEKGASNLTFTAILIKFTAQALKQFPKLNASLDLDSEEIIFKQFQNIGVAVDTPKGLMVPVVKHADQKGILTIADDLSYLSERARSGKLSLSEMSAATFTITNLGGLGTEYFTPIINAPESAILGIGRASYKPEWNGVELHPQNMLPLSLSFDHRLIDGAEGARFMQWLADAFENPLLLSMED